MSTDRSSGTYKTHSFASMKFILHSAFLFLPLFSTKEVLESEVVR